MEPQNHRTADPIDEIHFRIKEIRAQKGEAVCPRQPNGSLTGLRPEGDSLSYPQGGRN